MANQTPPSLLQVIFRLVFTRLFIPMLIVALASLVGLGYWQTQNLEGHQRQITQSLGGLVERHLDQGGRIVDAVALTAEVTDKAQLSNYMRSTSMAYGYFDAFYYLDNSKRVQLVVPYDPHDNQKLFNWHNLQSMNGKIYLFISRPFISRFSGKPAVYLVRPLSDGGYIVGELSLGLFQTEISEINGISNQDYIFITDKSGTPLAHPSSDLVKRQVSLSDLEILRDKPTESMIYRYNGTQVMGSVTRLKSTGWMIVDQTPLSHVWYTYAWIAGIIILASLVVLLALMWQLRRKLLRDVVSPLQQLAQKTHALTSGDYHWDDSLSVPSTFSELNKLLADFKFMSHTLHLRENALHKSEERYRGLFDRVPIGLFRTSPTGQILDINPAAVKIMGYPDRATLLGVNTSDLLVSPSINTQTPLDVYNFETQVQRYDGSIIWIKINVHVIYGLNGENLYSEGSLEDITERKQAEVKLIEAKDELELLVEQRTRELVTVNQELQRLSSLDGLTGIGNRRSLDAFLDHEWQRGMRSGTPVAFIMLDLDFFKLYNDTYGHQAGDDCLKSAAKTLQDSLKRSTDFAARYGGEEFAVVLPDADLAGASLLAEEIRSRIADLGIVNKESSIAPFVTVSIGVSALVPTPGSEPSVVIKAADQALYEAKHEGRNRVKTVQDYTTV